MPCRFSFELCTYGRSDLGFIITLYVDDVTFFIWHICIQLCLGAFNFWSTVPVLCFSYNFSRMQVLIGLWLFYMLLFYYHKIVKISQYFFYGVLDIKFWDPSVTRNKSVIPADGFREGKVNVNEEKHSVFLELS